MASDEGGGAATQVEEVPEAVGPDGAKYRLIQQTVRRLGASLNQLRYLEWVGSYTPLRAKDVPGLSPPLPPDTRLYPATAEADQQIEMALLRSRTHASVLAGQELTRKQAAAHLGVPQSLLRSWERHKKLVPQAGQVGRLHERSARQGANTPDRNKSLVTAVRALPPSPPTSQSHAARTAALAALTALSGPACISCRTHWLWKTRGKKLRILFCPGFSRALNSHVL
jgi:hypothetical protein